MDIAISSNVSTLRGEAQASLPTIQRIAYDNWQAFAANSPSPNSLIEQPFC